MRSARSIEVVNVVSGHLTPTEITQAIVDLVHRNHDALVATDGDDNEPDDDNRVHKLHHELHSADEEVE